MMTWHLIPMTSSFRRKQWLDNSCRGVFISWMGWCGIWFRDVFISRKWWCGISRRNVFILGSDDMVSHTHDLWNWWCGNLGYDFFISWNWWHGDSCRAFFISWNMMTWHLILHRLRFVETDDVAFDLASVSRSLLTWPFFFFSFFKAKGKHLYFLSDRISGAG